MALTSVLAYFGFLAGKGLALLFPEEFLQGKHYSFYGAGILLLLLSPIYFAISLVPTILIRQTPLFFGIASVLSSAFSHTPQNDSLIFLFGILAGGHFNKKEHLFLFSLFLFLPWLFSYI